MQLDQIEAVILAGGRGTRLARVLPHLPKPMAPVAGRPFVEWIVRHLGQAGLRNVTISTGHLAETIEAHFAKQPVPGSKVRCVREEEPLGTGGAFLHVVDRLGLHPPAWLVLNGDSLLFADWSLLAGQLDCDELDGLIVARRVDDTGRYGRLTVDAAGRLLAFAEKSPGASGPGLINGGVYLLRHRLLPGVTSRRPLSFELDLFPDWLAAGRRLDVYSVDTDFLDIGTEETLSQADEFILRHQNRFP